MFKKEERSQINNLTFHTKELENKCKQNSKLAKEKK
jgi:hypothetical protein